MKSLFALGLSFLQTFSLVALSPNTRAAPGVGTSFSADANWFFRTGKPHVYRWYSASVWGVNDLTADYVASIVRGTCRAAPSGDGIGCVGYFLGVAENQEVFEMDPAMQTAKLSLEDEDGNPMTVTWTAKIEAPWAGSMEEFCGIGASTSYFVDRRATAVADLVNKKLKKPAPIDGYDGTYLRRGAGVDACATAAPTDAGIRRYFSLRGESGLGQ